MKKISYLFILGIVILLFSLSGCSKRNTNNNLSLTNTSSETINSVAIKRSNQTDVMGSKLSPNESCYFDMGVQQNCTFTVEFEDKDNQIIKSNEFTANFDRNKDNIINIKISKNDAKGWDIKLEN